MNFLTAIIDGLVRFVQRNPLTTLVILILAIGARCSGGSHFFFSISLWESSYW